MALLALQAHNKLAALDIPDTNALIERSRGDEAIVGRDSDSGNAILDGEVGNLLVPLQVPETNTSITTSGGNDFTIAREVEGVDVLLVTSELVLDLTTRNIPYLDRN